MKTCSHVLAVYGIEGKLDSRYLVATQAVLQSIASVSKELNASSDLRANEAMNGVSRVLAHLQLLQHQVIPRATQGPCHTFANR